MQLRFLSDEFFADYAHCSEMEQKALRPYGVLLISTIGLDFAIPFRSNIKHDFVFWTDRENGCGLDYSKAVVIDLQRHIRYDRKPVIRKVEFKALLRQDTKIEAGLLRYINTYKKALRAPNNPRSQNILAFSTLKYFHQELRIETEEHIS
ncbi:MAG: hypothetical protein FWD06_04110 [Oscillospiraceae bacterium]|nr:hypothetical protein [Oscillospiraceae bacterium]